MSWFTSRGESSRSESLRLGFSQGACVNPYHLSSLLTWIYNPSINIALFKNPQDWITHILWYPFAVGNSSVSETTTLHIAGDNTNIPAGKLFSNSLLYMGNIKVNRKFNNYADYNGYTKIKLYLPMAGFINLDTNEVMDKYVVFRLAIDYITGNGCYYISTTNTTPNVPSYVNEYAIGGVNPNDDEIVIATKNVKVAYELPLTKTNSADIVRNAIFGALNMATSAASLGIISSNPTVAHTTSTETIKTRNRSGRMVKRSEMIGVKDVEYDRAPNTSPLFNSCLDSVRNMMLSSDTDKPDNSLLSLDGSSTVQMLIYRPKFIPTTSTFNFLYGKPLGETHYLKNLKGYTEVGSIHLEGDGFGQATSSEMLEIEQELSNGVIL